MNKKYTSIGLIILLVVINTALASFAFGLDFKSVKAQINEFNNPLEGPPPELQEVKKRFVEQESNFQEISTYFRNLAKEKGGKYAYDILKKAELPRGVDIHLLGHVVGEELYRQKGADGIKVCGHALRNACSHSIVVGLFQDYGGLNALDKIKKACEKAPGGKGAYTMCYHGLGHGVLQYVGFELPKAVDLCWKIETRPGYGGRERTQCVGGIIMEIVGGGFDNQKLYQEMKSKYLSKEDPLSPCNKDYIPEKAKEICYTYLTPHIWETVGIDLAKPLESKEKMRKAFQICDQIPKSRRGNRRACYGGFGKELVILVKGRDVRNEENLTDEQLQKAYEWCKLAGNKKGVSDCINSAAASLYWGGENDKSLVIRWCKTPKEERYRSKCFDFTFWAVNYYKKSDTEYKKDFCNSIPKKYQKECKDYVLN